MKLSQSTKTTYHVVHETHSISDENLKDLVHLIESNLKLNRRRKSGWFTSINNTTYLHLCLG